MTNKVSIILISSTLLLLTATSEASDIQNGQRIYNQNCMACHGMNGRPTMAMAPDFKRGEGLLQSDQKLLVRIQRGKRACPAYLGILSEQKIFDVIAYIRTLFP